MKEACGKWKGPRQASTVIRIFGIPYLSTSFPRSQWTGECGVTDRRLTLTLSDSRDFGPKCHSPVPSCRGRFATLHGLRRWKGVGTTCITLVFPILTSLVSFVRVVRVTSDTGGLDEPNEARVCGPPSLIPFYQSFTHYARSSFLHSYTHDGA